MGRLFAALVGFLLIVIVLLRGCMNGDGSSLPEGVQTLTGAILSAEVSLTRRGTHVLAIDGEEQAYLESSTLNLDPYEGFVVAVQGVFESNINPEELPVIVVSAVNMPAYESTNVTIDALRMSLSVPAGFSLQQTASGAVLSESGSVTQLRIERTDLTALPSEGIPIRVAGRRGVLVREETTTSLYVQSAEDIIAFHMTDYAQAIAARGDLLLPIIRSVSFGSASSSSLPSSVRSGASSRTSSPALGQPCGGPAGVLCPAGSYCEITDTVTGIGRCRNF